MKSLSNLDFLKIFFFTFLLLKGLASLPGRYRVPRWRLKLEAADSWQLLYAGPGTSYEAQGLVPVTVHSLSSVHQRSCSFFLPFSLFFKKYEFEVYVGVNLCL